MLKVIFILIVFTLSHSITFGQYRLKYVANVGGQFNGVVKLKAFQVQQGVGAERYLGGNHWEPISVDSFRISVLRGDSVVMSTSNKGRDFTQQVRAVLASLSIGDRVLIFDIWASDFDKRKVYLSPLEYVMH
jgi:hypothetical protein